MQRRDRAMGQSLGAQLLKKVKASRVLVVGAGGIGCELLKNLVCSGFGSLSAAQAATIGAEAQANGETRIPEIVVVDLDTIDLSNLNRQFLFRSKHIKKPKATVAKETVSQFNPSVNIGAHHANILDKQYDVDFFESFDLVFNALDNLTARRHVNKMCLAANVPLIESGTTGFMGQVQVIKKDVTECYDCTTKPVQKTFPICTIRSTPSQPIHCIVWAKSYLFPELFGTSEEESSDMAVTDGDDAEEVLKLKEEAQALKKIRGIMGKSEFAQEVFNKVFHDDIERLRSMTEMWQHRKPPDSLKFDAQVENSILLKQGQAAALEDQKTWTLLENISVFCSSIDALSTRVQAGETVEFDKDDKDTLDLVASAANLRSHIFGVQLHSEWEIKQMAGNIIPAIATSNALTGSLCVLEALKILRSETKHYIAQHATTENDVPAQTSRDVSLGGSKMVFLTSKSTDKLISPQGLSGPKVDCPVCSPVYAKVVLPKGSTSTLQELVDVLKRRAGYEDFSIMVGSEAIYDPDLEDNLDKTLAELGFEAGSNSFLTVLDDSDAPKVDLVLSAKLQSGEGTDLHILPEALPLKPKAKPAEEENNGKMEVDAAPIPEAGSKRKREASEEVESVKKKAKGNEGEVVNLVADDGAIILD